jgi:hypothetical protein
MGSEPISESSFTAVINAPIEKVDLADWLFGLSDAEYQRCSPAHIAAGTTRSEDGKRMSINVEMIGGSIVVQHYVEDIAEKHHIRLISLSDTFSPIVPAIVLGRHHPFTAARHKCLQPCVGAQGPARTN